MPKEVLQDFRFGLDTRRSMLTSRPGALLECKDAVVNQGGQIELRKAFVPVSCAPSVPSGITALLGCEALTSRIVLFGGEADAAAGAWLPANTAYYRIYRAYGCQVNLSSGTSGSTTITAPKVGGGTAVTIASSVAWSSSIAGTVTAVIAAINAGTATHGYSAQGTGAYFTINSPPSVRNDAKTRITITVTGNLVYAKAYLIPSANATSVIWSTVYGGYVWLLAGLDDDSICAFYCNGVAPYEANPLVQSFEGLILKDRVSGNPMSTDEFMAVLAQSVANIPGNLYKGTHSPVTPTTSPIQGLGASQYNTDVVNVGDIAVISAVIDSTSKAGDEGKQSVGGFTITGGAPGSPTSDNGIVSVKVGSTELLVGAPDQVDFVTDVHTTVVAVVTAINANSGVSGYKATAGKDTITIYSVAVGAGDATLTVKTKGNVTTDFAILNFSGTSFSLTNINVNGGNRLSVSLDYPGAYSSLSDYVEAIATAVRASVTIAGVKVLAYHPTGSNLLYLSRNLVTCKDPILAINALWTGDAVITSGAGQPSSALATIKGGTILEEVVGAMWIGGVTVRRGLNASNAITNGKSVHVDPSGGKPPYSFLWEFGPIPKDCPFDVAFLDRTKQTTLIYSAFKIEVLKTPAELLPKGFFNVFCTITDSAGVVVTSPNIVIMY